MRLQDAISMTVVQIQGATWTPERKLQYVMREGHILAAKVLADDAVPELMRRIDRLNSNYESMILQMAHVSHKLNTARTEQDMELFGALSRELYDWMRKSGGLYDQRDRLNQDLCKRIFSVIGYNGGSLAMDIDHPARQEILHATNKFMRYVATPADRTVTVRDVREHGDGFQRSYYTDADRTVHLRESPSIGTVWHELGHMMEHERDLGDITHLYYRYRTQGEPTQQMSELDPRRPGYQSEEEGKEGDFVDSYIGKIYVDGGTELISMGMQLLIEDPVRLITRDREYFEFLLGIIQSVRRGDPWD